MSAVELYVLSGMCMVLFVILVFQIKPANVKYMNKGLIAVKTGNKIVKVSIDDLHTVIINYQDKFTKLRRHSNSKNPNIAKVTAGLRRFTVANTRENVEYNFPLVVDFLNDSDDLNDLDEPEDPYSMLMFELARLDKIIPFNPVNLMLDLDAIESLLKQLNAQAINTDTSYIGENRAPSFNIKPVSGSGITLNAPLKFDESKELDHRMYKPSKDIRPSQGEQSQEYEDF